MYDVSDLLYRGLSAQAPPLTGSGTARPDKFGTPRVLYYLCGHGNKDTFRLFGEYLPLPGCRRNHAAHRPRTRARGGGCGRLGRDICRAHGRIARCPHAAGCVAPRLRTDAPCPADPRGGLREIRHDRGDGRPQLRARAPTGAVACGCRQDLPYAGVFSRHPGWDHVPDPYYEGAGGFELVLDMLEDGCEGILAHLGK